MQNLEATVTCPACGHKSIEEMPTDRCIYFYECLGCRRLLRPRQGDCCVFCSYGDKCCPVKQDDDGVNAYDIAGKALDCCDLRSVHVMRGNLRSFRLDRTIGMAGHAVP